MVNQMSRTLASQNLTGLHHTCCSSQLVSPVTLRNCTSPLLHNFHFSTEVKLKNGQISPIFGKIESKPISHLQTVPSCRYMAVV